jgi:predicted permease
MTFITRLQSWFRNLLHRSRAERDMDAELHFHVEARAEDLVRSGVPREEALRRARLEFGGIEQAKEQCRDARGVTFAETLSQDLHYGLRIFLKNPGFTAVIILTLALGIGANTAIFSLINAVMLRAVPVRNPQQLVVFRWQARTNPKFHGYSSHGDCGRGGEGFGCSFSVPLFERMHSDAKVFSSLTAFAGPRQIDVGGNGPASIGRGELVSGDFFQTLGVGTYIGRPIGPEDDTTSASPVAVLSYAYWKGSFASDPNVIGRTFQLNGMPCTIVGVAAESFTNLAPGKTQDFFLPIHSLERLNLMWYGELSPLADSQSWWTVIVGRLNDGVSLQQAQSAATSIFYNEMLHGAKPLSKPADNPSIQLIPVNSGLTGARAGYSTVLYVLMAAVGFVLLIACANVAGLMLSRSTARQREIAVRLALGGGRRRIARQLLTESLALSVAGGFLGILLAQWGVHAMQKLFSNSPEQPFPFVVTPDWRVLLFVLSVSVLTGLLFGIAPALRSTRIDLTPALKESAATFQGRTLRGFRLGGALVAVQVALSILVLVGAGLLVRTLHSLRSIDPGFDTSNIVLFGIDPSLLKYDEDRIQNLYRDLRDRFAAVPGVVSASYTSDALLSGSLWSTSFHLPGQPEKSGLGTDILAVGPDFLQTLRIPLVDGRSFTQADFSAAAITQSSRTAAQKARANALNAPASWPGPDIKGPPVPVLVNQEFIKRYLPKQAYLGRHLDDSQGEEPGPKTPGYEIIGVVGNTKYQDLRTEIAPTAYVPLVRGGCHFELRTALPPDSLIPTIRNIVTAADSNLPIFDILTQSERIEEMMIQERIIARLSSFFGILALLLACIGLYGLLAYEVSRRTREIGVRVALGAQQSNVIGLVVKQGLVLVVLGALYGVAAALALTQYLRSLLFGVEPMDPVTFVSVVALLFLVALAACYIPARRASQVDPMVALRHE